MVLHASNFLMLPDEMLIEIYKYLLNAHVLLSFYGLNQRLNMSITGYFRHVSLTDISCNQSCYLCRFVLPNIGTHIRRLLISNCRSVLEGKIFSTFFSHQMSKIFPNLKTIKLICFTADELYTFLDTLTDLEYLDQIEILDLLTDQSNLFQHVVEANNNRFTSIKFKKSYSDLPMSLCLNIVDLTISVQTVDKLPQLLSCVTNIRRLNISVDQTMIVGVSFDHISQLNFLKDFFLRCYDHFWTFIELQSLLNKLPVIERLSFQLSSHDITFVNEEQSLMKILPKTLQQFNFGLRYFYDELEEIHSNALLNSRFPIICLIDESLQQAFLHTLSYGFPLLNISPSMAKQMLESKYYENVETFYDYHGMSLAETFSIVARCRRIKEIAIQSYVKCDELSSVPQSVFSLPNLFYLKRIWLLHSSREYNALKAILQIAPNLSELFIAFDNLLPILCDKDTCKLLANRIVHLLILRSAPAAPTQLTEEYIPCLRTTFMRLRHLQIDVTQGRPIEAITLSILNSFKEQSQLISLVVEGESSCNELKSNTREWLINNSYLTNDQTFEAEFKEQTNRLLLWM